jgi:hypothetical protein
MEEVASNSFKIFSAERFSRKQLVKKSINHNLRLWLNRLRDGEKVQFKINVRETELQVNNYKAWVLKPR